jgi:hypothetical protein
VPFAFSSRLVASRIPASASSNPRSPRRLAALAATTASPAQALARDGFFAPAGGATLTAGAVAEARWIAPEHDGAGIDEAELVLSVDGGLTFPVRLSAELSPHASSYRWRVPALATTHARLGLRVGVEHEAERERIVLVARNSRSSRTPRSRPPSSAALPSGGPSRP